LCYIPQIRVGVCGVALPRLFEHTIFSGMIPMKTSAFIQAPHPKTAISPTRAAIKTVLEAGWWGQVKIHGHRAQIHIPSDPSLPVVNYTRHGSQHKVILPEQIALELRRLLAPVEGYSAIDAEWVKDEKRILLFDYLKRNGRVLSSLTYAQRYEFLPRVYRSSCIETMPVLKTLDDCLAVLASDNPLVEGLVFKSPATVGFRDSAIVRCRRS
jgi:ATP-dependent DNA ligase